MQSDLKYIYSKIKEILSANKKILFSGTPCQVSGLYAYLGKDYKNLLTAEVICHGVPSPKVWERYIQELGKNQIEEINFRDKETLTWKDSGIKIKFKSKNSFTETQTKNIYFLGFNKNLFFRECCYFCKFVGFPRHADFTMGDFWGYETNCENIGVSAVLVNTKKGVGYLNKVKPQLKLCEKTELKKIILHNSNLIQPSNGNPKRKLFFQELHSQSSIKQLIQKCIARNYMENEEFNKNNKVAILNFSSNTNGNYGALLVGFALEKAVNLMGFDASTVNFIPEARIYELTEHNVFFGL